MPASPVQRLLALAILIVAAAGWARWLASDEPLARSGGSGFAITDAERRAELRFAPDVAVADREWFLAAIAKARPEAQRMIAEVDGRLEVRTHRGEPLGFTAVGAGRLRDLPRRRHSRRRSHRRTATSTVLHELGHAVDVRARVRRRSCIGSTPASRGRATAAPPARSPSGPARAEIERFADTFAKWALRGAVSQVGAGYGIAMPPSLEAGASRWPSWPPRRARGLRRRLPAG